MELDRRRLASSSAPSSGRAAAGAVAPWPAPSGFTTPSAFWQQPGDNERFVEVCDFTNGTYTNFNDAEKSDFIAMDEVWNYRRLESGPWRPVTGFDDDKHVAFSIKDSWACLSYRGNFYIMKA
eukprot:8303766-Pyramimonas_sp.AAC.1